MRTQLSNRLGHERGYRKQVGSRERLSIVSAMSLNEIMEELPKLSLAERRQLTRQLINLEPDHESLEACDRLADEAMQVLDRMEEEDGRRSSKG